MAHEKQSVESLLGHDKWNWAKKSHITIKNNLLCQTCDLKPCLRVCPAKVYTWTGEKVAVNYEACLELRACYVSCHEYGNGAIEWVYPPGGLGVLFRKG
ncbi:MAG: hypothetical protein QW767_01200 [Thermoprotei archaeon]